MPIRSMHDAVQTIGRAVRIDDLAPNAQGAFELVFFDQLQVYFQEVSDTELEVQLRLGEGQRLGPDLMQAMLAANLSLRHGRLALEPGTDRVVYCGRINISQLGSDTLMPAVTAIIREGAAWRLETFADLGRDVAALHSTADVMSETLIRV
jgi:hypothetical protein